MRTLRHSVVVVLVGVIIISAAGMAFSAGGRSGGGHGGGHSGGSYRGGGYGGSHSGGYYRGGGHDGGHHGGYYWSGYGGVVIGGPYWGASWYSPYYYPYYYPWYPNYYPYYPYATEVTVPSRPQEYIERSRERSSPRASGVWYFCPESNTYYPYVRECPDGWQKVPAQPPSETGR